eukprot:Clim_evm44s150 gene=Clim_evmTU44s150
MPVTDRSSEAAARMDSKRKITQDTFDQVVKENVDDFDMSIDEAIKDAVGQFEAQGVDLGDVITENLKYSGAGSAEGGDSVPPPVAEANKVKALLKDEGDPVTVLTSARDVLVNEKKSAGKTAFVAAGGLGDSLALAKTYFATGNYAMVDLALQTARAAMPGCRQAKMALTREECEFLVDIVKARIPVVTTGAIPAGSLSTARKSSWYTMRSATAKCERNRGRFMALEAWKLALENLQLCSEAGYGNKAAGAGFDPTQGSPDDRAAEVRGILSFIRASTIDDDDEAAVSMASDYIRHYMEHGFKDIALNMVNDLRPTELGQQPERMDLIADLISTFSKISVSTQLLTDPEGTTEHILTLVQEFSAVEEADSQGLDEVLAAAMSFLRLIGAADECKRLLISRNFHSTVLSLLQRYGRDSKEIAEQGLGTLSTMTLRQQEFSRSFVQIDAGHREVINIMRVHKENGSVARQGCYILRNVSVRNQQNVVSLRECGAEAIVQEIRSKHQRCDDAAKAALRDMGCKVELKEEWTGVPEHLRGKENLDDLDNAVL